MGSRGGQRGVSKQEHYFHKYFLCVSRPGKKAFHQVFSWGRRGAGGLPPAGPDIKDALLALPGYSNAQLRKIFNKAQQQKLDQHLPCEQFDISFTYLLLQRLCGLAEADDAVWVTAGSDALEHCLYMLKLLRNHISHETFNLSAQDLEEKVKDVADLITKILQKAGEKFSINTNEIDLIVKDIIEELYSIKDSPLPHLTPEEQEEYRREILANRKRRLTEEARKEITKTYESICRFREVPWLVTGRSAAVAEVFVPPNLMRDETQVSQRQLTEKERTVEVNEVLVTKHCSGEQPQVTLLSGQSGMGKTAIIKYVLDNAMRDQPLVTGIDVNVLVLFLQCQTTTISSLDDMLVKLLPQTAKTFHKDEYRQALLSLDFLLLIDDIDYLDISVIKEFLKVKSSDTRILASVASEKADSVFKLMNHYVSSLMLEIEGIPGKHTLNFLKNSLTVYHHSSAHQNVNSTDVHKTKDLCDLIESKISSLQDHLRSPEILNLIALCWSSEQSNRLNCRSTVTDIFMLLEDLLIHKVMLRVSEAGQDALSVSEKNRMEASLREFLLALADVALSCVTRGETTLTRDIVLRLEKLCQQLKLATDQIIPSFLCYKCGGGSDTHEQIYFPRQVMMHYYAAWSVVQCLRELPPSATVREAARMRTTNLTPAQTSSMQAMMRFFVGILVSLHPTYLEHNSREIVDILKALNVNTVSEWMSYIEEAKGQPQLTEQIMKELGNEWKVRNHISQTLLTVLDTAKLSRLIFSIEKSPHNCPRLKEALRACSSLPGVRLSLYLYQHFRSEKVTTSDEYLRLVTANGSCCVLEHFAGRLGADAVAELPQSLQILALHVTQETLTALNTALPNLPQLQFLYLTLDIPVASDVQLVQPLSLSEQLQGLSVDIWKVSKDEIAWASSLTRKLSRTYSCLALRGSDLTGGECRLWMEALQRHQVQVDWLVVCSTQVVSQEDKQALLRQSSHVGCSTFDWIQI